MVSLLVASIAAAQGQATAPALAIVSSRKLQGLHAVSVAASPSGARLAMGLEGGTLRIVDANTGQTLKELPGHPQDAKALAWSPNGKILASGDESARIFLWDTATWNRREFRPHTKAIQSLAFNRAGTMMLSTGADDEIKLWNLNDLKKPVLDYKGKGANVYGATFIGGTNDFACATLTNTAFVISPQGVVKKKLIILNNLVGSNDITINPAATTAITAGRDNAAAVFDLKTAARTAYLRGHSDWVTHVQFSPNGRWVATSSSDGTVRLYNIKSGKTVTTLSQQAGVGSPLAFTSDGKYLVTIDAFDSLSINKLSISVAGSGGRVAEVDLPGSKKVVAKKAPAKKQPRRAGRH